MAENKGSTQKETTGGHTGTGAAAARERRPQGEALNEVATSLTMLQSRAWTLAYAAFQRGDEGLVREIARNLQTFNFPNA